MDDKDNGGKRRKLSELSASKSNQSDIHEEQPDDGNHDEGYAYEIKVKEVQDIDD